MTGLKQYEKDVTSQWGEDGVIEEIFNRIGATSKICVDIGAWDGKHLSNTFHLSEKSWNREMWEMDFSKSGGAAMGWISIGVWYRMCNSKMENLDEQLYDIIPFDFDFLNIDIDGDDYYLWKDMVKYKPRVICIEYNQTVAPGISVVQERGGTFGASSKALMDLAEEKGYVFVHATVTNMFFVLKEYKNHFPSTSGIPTEWVVYGGIGYNGKRYQFGKQAHNDDQGGEHEKLITCKEIVNV